MINWYGVLVLSFVLSNLLNIVFTGLGFIPVLTGALLYLFGIPIVFIMFGFLIAKLEEKGYIKDELPR